MKREPTYTTVDEYISEFPPEIGKILQKIRSVIRKAAPRAEESISYQIPAFKLDGKNLIYFAAFKNHISVYPAPRGSAEFREDCQVIRAARARSSSRSAGPFLTNL